MRIGLSYHGGDPDYEAYPNALQRRAQTLGIAIETLWLAGTERPTLADRLMTLDAVLFTGGADVEPHRYGAEDREGMCRCDPRRDELEWAILQRLMPLRIPLLAICRGAQILNVFHGGSLIQDLGERNAVHRRDAEHDRRQHDVSIAEGTRLHGITETRLGLVNTSHHQAVDRLAIDFRVSARCDDGVIEAFEPTDLRANPFLLAVQWHPEAMEPGLPLADRVLDAFLTAEH